MNYINPVEYSKLLKSFTQGATKKVIKESVDKKEEGMHLGQPTAPTTTKVESKQRNYENLSVDERKQLKELIESVKTIKQEIKKLMGKATMGEGGDMTNLVFTKEGDDDSDYDEDEINRAGEEDRAWKEKERALDTRMIGKNDMDIDDMDDEFGDIEQRDREERYRMAGPGREA